MARILRSVWLSIGALVVSAGACSASDDGGASGGNGGSSASGGAHSTGGSGALAIDGSATGGSGALPDGAECASELFKAEQVPLDLYVMLDRSGSMLDPTAAGTSKWDAVKQALSSFVNDAGSAGIGVGLQYFPLDQPGVPDSCTSSAQCGVGAPCLLKSCSQATGSVQPCDTNADCPGAFNDCIDLGQCSLNPNFLCIPVGGTSCGTDGACVQISSSYCVNATSCLVGDYAVAAVPIATLPGNATAVVNSINAQDPFGNTPTGPALQGAIDQAKAFNQQNPTHRVAVVLATDGLPTSCNPTDINQIAALAAAVQPQITTFVIGVFGPSDANAQQNLNVIAQSGGSGSAFMIDTSQNVTQQFLAALAQIKGAALACEFQIPAPTAGKLDYGKVNVDVTTPSGKQTLFYVGDASKCDPVSGGWYYDVEPGAGTPTKILVCPTTCDAFEASSETQVQVRMGCQTMRPPT